MSPELIQLLAAAVLALGGLSGLGAFISVIFQRRKLRAEAEKTGVDAGQVIVTTSLNLMEEMKNDNEELRDEVDDLRDYVDLLVEAMRANGMVIPPRPPRRRRRPAQTVQ